MALKSCERSADCSDDGSGLASGSCGVTAGGAILRPSAAHCSPVSNAEALTGLAAWLAPANREPVFLFWGEAGAGKSHLLQACQAAYSDARVDPDLSRMAPTGEFYAVDHVEALGETGQIVLFNLINRLRAIGGRLPPGRCDHRRRAGPLNRE
jgi:hypothetical protein